MHTGISTEELINDIAVIRFEEVSQRAVDSFIQLLIEGTGKNYHRLLVDNRIGLQPIRYTFEKLQNTFRNATLFIAQDQMNYIALVMDDSILISVAMTFVRTLALKNVEFRFFKKNEYDAAIAWLESK